MKDLGEGRRARYRHGRGNSQLEPTEGKGRLGVSHKQSLVDGKDVLEYPVYRAIHLELVKSLETGVFMMALHRRGRRAWEVSYKQRLVDGNTSEKYPTSSVSWTERTSWSIPQAESRGRKGRLGVSHKQSLVDGKDVLEYPTSRVSWTERTSWSIPQAESRGRKGHGKDALDIARATTKWNQAKPATVLHPRSPAPTSWSIRQIAADTHLGASTVHRLWRRWLEQGNVAIYRNVGATRVTSARVDRRILRQAVAAPQATCTAILQHVQDTLDHSISTRTISRRLVANGLHSCRPLRRLPLTPPNRRQRLEWCRARSTWMTEWHRVVFSDESRFCLSSDSRRVRVWRRRGERSNPAAIVERPTVRQRGIMVWGAIAYDSRSPLLRIQGTMTAQRYVDDVLRPVTLPYLQGVPNALYQQDNARPHTARISQQALQDVQMLPWPPYSPDLSPIEHVWDIIGRRLHALPQLRSEDELWQMVEREWRAIPQDAIRTLIDSLPRRVAACIAVRGGPTCY
ncbi:Transposase [Cordylochernes scorpioides]|uniref:Transposase n=1 Tax=Cordylochernes scorpioides TaxID=51811 RepID=A0ABY6JW55_9ARAC|nr:Transposase [Cordylochernes scorpioides]